MFSREWRINFFTLGEAYATLLTRASPTVLPISGLTSKIVNLVWRL